MDVGVEEDGFLDACFECNQLFRRSRVTGLLEGRCEPLKTFVQTVSGGCASRLDELEGVLLAMMCIELSTEIAYPGPLSEGVKTKLVSDLCGVHGILQSVLLAFATLMVVRLETYWQILFVRKDKEERLAELVFVQHALQLLTSLDYTVAIVAVNDEDDTLGVLEVMSPERSDLILSADIPHGELNVLVLDGLDVEA
jgi:hypothetical protein